MTPSEQPILNAAKFGSWRLDITNTIDPPIITTKALGPVDFTTGVQMTATFSVDQEKYEALLHGQPEALFTVEHEVDHNPWHRTVTDWRGRLRKVRAGLWWTFQRRVLRRELIERTKITVPNCRLSVRDE